MAKLKGLPEELTGIPLGKKQWENFRAAGLVTVNLVKRWAETGEPKIDGAGKGRREQVATWLKNGAHQSEEGKGGDEVEEATVKSVGTTSPPTALVRLADDNGVLILSAEYSGLNAPSQNHVICYRVNFQWIEPPTKLYAEVTYPDRVKQIAWEIPKGHMGQVTEETRFLLFDAATLKLPIYARIVMEFGEEKVFSPHQIILTYDHNDKEKLKAWVELYIGEIVEELIDVEIAPLGAGPITELPPGVIIGAHPGHPTLAVVKTRETEPAVETSAPEIPSHKDQDRRGEFPLVRAGDPGSASHQLICMTFEHRGLQEMLRTTCDPKTGEFPPWLADTLDQFEVATTEQVESCAHLIKWAEFELQRFKWYKGKADSERAKFERGIKKLRGALLFHMSDQAMKSMSAGQFRLNCIDHDWRIHSINWGCIPRTVLDNPALFTTEPFVTDNTMGMKTKANKKALTAYVKQYGPIPGVIMWRSLELRVS